MMLVNTSAIEVPSHYRPASNVGELASSIIEYGVLQPILVREKGPEAYELVAGHRRLEACKKVGLTEIPCIVIAAEHRTVISLVENIHQAKLHPLDRAQAFKDALEESGLNAHQLAAKLSKPYNQVHSTLSLLTLSPQQKADFRAGLITYSQCVALATAKDPNKVTNYKDCTDTQIREAVKKAGLNKIKPRPRGWVDEVAKTRRELEELLKCRLDEDAIPVMKRAIEDLKALGYGALKVA
jgi:ParB/RepB/Spo0J family partition protein